MPGNSIIEQLYAYYLQYPIICTDTRAIKSNSIFFALKGPNFNANAYAGEALIKGAKLAVIDDEKYKLNDNCFLVPNCLEALQQLAMLHRKRMNIPFIGITGSNGKTTTKELMYRVLSKKYNTLATQGNLNNHIGVPLTVLSVSQQHEMAIIEMGANHLGEITQLCEIAKPNYGIITNIGKAHLEGFGGAKGVIKAKNELYNYIKKTKGSLFVNSDNELLMDLSSASTRILYGTDTKSNFIGINNNTTPIVSLGFKQKNDSNFTPANTQLVGNYNFENILAAACIGNYFKINSEKIKQAIEEYTPTNSRSQVIKKGNNAILLDAYNANPTSMKAALENFYELKAENKVVILGDMMELGADSEKEHEEILSLIKKYGGQCAYFAGTNFYALKDKYPGHFFTDTSLLKNHLSASPLNNKNILIKGSRSMKLETLVEAL